MISMKVLGVAAAMALVAIPVASFAQSGGPVIPRLGGGVGGGPAPIVYGNNSAANLRLGGGGAPPSRVGGGGGPGPRIGGGGGGYRGGYGGGGGYRGGYGGGRGYYRGGGYIPGAVAGAVIGGAIASQGYYGGPGYYGGSSYGYYDDGNVDDGVVAVAPGGGDDDAYCRQTYRSYDPRSGTYLGFDGLRHSCP